jgi:predicted nucleotidyltransferase
MLPLLTETERRRVARYVETLRERLGPRLLGVRVFGSVARGEAWPQGMPIRSDLDLLVLVRDELTEACRKTIGGFWWSAQQQVGELLADLLLQ